MKIPILAPELHPGRSLFVVLVAAVLVSSCSSSKADRTSEDGAVVDRPQAVSDPVEPNHCRVLATVIRIHALKSGTTSNDLCARFPCVATVRLDSILGYGSGFSGALGIGQELEVQFAFTLAPSREAYPDASFTLPGLSVGDRFQADLSGSGEMMEPGSEVPRARFGAALYKTKP